MAPSQITLLHIVCQLCNEDLVALILYRENIDPLPLNVCGWTPLCLAV